jgi:DNA-directed RNA polymerase subunit K/omega
MNKYEMVMIAAREARRLNDIARISGRDLKIRPTTLAWKLLHDGKIKYTFSSEPFDQETSLESIEGIVPPSPPPEVESEEEDESESEVEA